MIDITDARLIGKGSSRLCYEHPGDGGKCIKVVYTKNCSIVSEELKHYRLCEKRQVSWDMMAKSFGTVLTSAGEGAVFSLPRDFDGEVSKTMAHYLHSGLAVPEAEVFCRAVKAFREYLFRERIIVRELKADNLVYKRYSRDAGKLVLVDGLGNNEFLPIANYSDIFAKRTLAKKWRKFVCHLQHDFSHSPLLQNLLSRVRS